MKIPRRLILLMLLAAAGVALNVALSLHFYGLRGGTAAFKSFCNVSEKLNCDAVAMSRFAEIVPGMPLSDLAVAWFLALLVIAGVATQRFWRREALRMAAGLAAGGLLVSLVYFVVMHSVLKTYCMLCLIQDGVVLAATALVFSLKPESFKSHKPEKSKWKTLGLAVTLTGLGGMVLMRLLFSPSSLPGDMQEEYMKSVLEAPVVAVNDGDEYPQFGPKGAPIKVVEFSDFQCPFCRNGAITLNTLASRYKDNLRVVFRNYPLDAGCNPKVQGRGHTHACEAAKATWCANPQGKFKPFYEELFDKQRSLGPGVILEIAKQVGLDTDRLQGCMGSQETMLAVQRDISEGERLGVKSTPTFFINGHKMEGAYPLEIWVRIFDRLLAKDGGRK